MSKLIPVLAVLLLAGCVSQPWEVNGEPRYTVETELEGQWEIHGHADNRPKWHATGACNSSTHAWEDDYSATRVTDHRTGEVTEYSCDELLN